MTSRKVLAIVCLGLLAFFSVGCPNKQKDAGAAAEATGSAAPGAKAPNGDEKDDEKDDDEDDEKDDSKKDEGGW